MSGPHILMTLDAAGGVWRYAMDLAKAMKEHTFVFLGFGPPPSVQQRAEAEAIGELCWSKLPLDWMVPDPVALQDVPDEVSRTAARYAVDVIHLNLPSQAAGLQTERPVVIVSHSCVATWFRGVKGTDLPPNWAWQGNLNRMGLLRADVVLAPSASHAALMTGAYGPIPITVVPNATLAHDRQATDVPKVIASGRWWDEGKNGATLDAAAARMDWPLTMLGPLKGPTGQGFRPQHATAPGNLPHGDAMAMMRDAGIFVSPSLYEPFGLAVAEAARCAIPLMLADIPTFRELWDGAAIFFPTRDSTALADAVNELSADAELRRRLGRAALLRSRKFAPEVQAQAMTAIYARLAHQSQTIDRR